MTMKEYVESQYRGGADLGQVYNAVYNHALTDAHEAGAIGAARGEWARREAQKAVEMFDALEN